MKRDIKFRAWDVGLGEMIPVHDIQFHDPVTRHMDGIALKPRTTQPTIINKRTTWRQVHDDDAVLMQFTGLTDKRGQKIYEADIANARGFEPEAHIARFNRGAFCLEPITGIECHFWSDIKYVKDEHGEVIGNICENSELLEPTKGANQG